MLTEGGGETMTLEAIEFVRRFLLHVLPSGFVRIRHYGLLANWVMPGEAGAVPGVVGSRPDGRLGPARSRRNTRAWINRDTNPGLPEMWCRSDDRDRATPPATIAEGRLVRTNPCLTLDSS